MDGPEKGSLWDNMPAPCPLPPVPDWSNLTPSCPASTPADLMLLKGACLLRTSKSLQRQRVARVADPGVPEV